MIAQFTLGAPEEKNCSGAREGLESTAKSARELDSGECNEFIE